MPIGRSLSQLIDDFRAEAGLSLNAADNQQTRTSQIARLNRVQRQLASEHEWVHLWVTRTDTLANGQYQYTLPADLPFENISGVYYNEGDRAVPLRYGFGAEEEAHKPLATETCWPPRAWRVDGDDITQMEIWPTPNQAATLYIEGYMVPTNMVQDSDVTVIDSDIIALVAAAEVLGRSNQSDAAVKLDTAQRRIRALKGNQSARKQVTPPMLGGGLRHETRWHGRRFRVPGEGS